MEENQYRQLLNKAPFGYAYHQLVLNDEGIPVDYIFLEVNETFEQLTGLKAKNILNKKATEIIPNIKEGNFDWIKIYGEITLNMQTKEFEQFFPPFKKWYKISASANDTEHFTTLFTDITAQQIVAKKIQELIDSTSDTIDYNKICETVREISGARYVIFNKFEPNGKDFTTMAIGGLSELKKITEMLGFEIIKKQWKYDPDRELRIQNNKTTEFKSLSDLSGTVITESIANLIQHTFNLSEFYIIKTMRNHLAIGDCTLFFKKGSTFLNKELTETFVDAIGITLSRIADEELLTENENRYLELAEQSETITWEINKSGRYTFISPFIEKLLGYTPEEVIGKMHFYDLHPEKNEGFLLSASLQLFINKIPINNLENELLTKSNEIIWVSTTCLPVFDRYGELSGYRGTDTNINEKKLNEQKIKEKTILLQQITDNMNDAIFSLDLNLNLTYISPSIEKLTGFSPEIYKTRKIEDRFTENSQNKIYALFSKELENEKDPTINKKRIIKAELEEYTADGSIIWVSIHISFIHDKNGVLKGFVGSSRDITERKTAERILRDSEEKFSKAFQGSPVSSFITRAMDGKIIDVNENFVALSGYNKEEALLSSSIHLSLWANIEDRDWVISSLNSGVEITNKEFQFRIKNNNLVTGLFSAQLIHINNEQYLLSNILDITELKNSNANLQESEKKHRLLIENSRDIIYTLTPDGIFTFASPSWTTLLGHQLSEVIGHSFQEFVHPDDLPLCLNWLQKTLSSNERSDNVEYRVKHADGSLHWHSSGGITLINLEGKIIGVEGIAHEITKRKLAEIELQKSDARFKNMFDNHPAPMFLIEPLSGEILNTNAAASRFYGYSIPTLTSMKVSDINTLSPEQILEERMKAINNTKHVFVFPHRLANNEIRTVEVHSSAIEYEGAPVLFSIIQDITERMTTDYLLEQTRQNYKNFFNTINDFMFVLDEQGNIIYVNDTVLHRLGYTSEELLGQSILITHPIDRQEEAKQTIKEMLEGTTDFCPIPLVTKSGHHILVETRVSKGMWDDKKAIFGVSTDISKTVLSEEKFSKVFYLNPSACGLTDLITRKYVEVNDTFLKLFGFTREEVIGKTATELDILTTDAITKIMLNANTNGNVSNVEAKLKAKNGDIKHVLLSSENIIIQDQKFLYTVVQDITERKQAEKNQIIFSSLIQNSSTIFVVKDLDFRIIAANKAFLKATSFNTIEELIGKNDADLLGMPENSQTVLDYKFDDFTAANLAPGETISNEELIPTSKGTITSLTQKFPIYDKDNKLIGIGVMSTDITESKKKEQMLIDSQAVAKIGSYITSLGSSEFTENTWEASQEIYKIFGIEEDYPKTLASWIAFIHPDSKEELLNYHKKVVIEHIPFNHEYKIIRISDGEERWVHGTGETTYDKNGNPIKMQGAIQDITERKQAEERINERGRFIESLVNLSPNVLYIYDIIEKRNIYTNDGIQRFLGYSIKEIKDMDNQIIANLMHPDDFKIYLNETLPKYAIAKDNEQIIATYRMKHKNGNWKWFTATEIIYSKNNKEEPRQIFGMMIDITELKQIELDLTTAKKEAEESEQRFKIASQSANLGIWDWNVRDNTMIWDERMYDLYGIDKESTVKTIDLWITGLHPEDKDAAIAACNDALEGKSTFDTSFRVKHPDGKVLYLKADGLVIMGSEGQAIRMIGVNRDVTKSKQAEEYRTMNMEILQKLNTKDTLKDSIHNVLTILKTHLNFDAIGIRLQAGEDFPYYTQNGFSEDFLLMENSLLEHNSSGGICRNPDGSACLECTCGLVISGTADLSNPLFTKGGSAWTNDSFQLLDIPLADYPRHNPRNTCMHKGYGSLALVPIKANNKIIGLIQVNDKRKGQLNLELIEFLETIASNIGSSLLRKKAEENLQINEQKQTTMISNISDVIGIIGTDGLIKYKSPTITKYFGWLPSDLVEADAWSTVHPDDLGRCKQAFYSLILENQESTTIEYKYKCKDGSYKPIKLTATNLVNDPTIAGVLLNYHDITDRKLSEKTLQESEEKFRKAFMTSLDAIAINRLEDGMYISINDGFTKILDYSSDEIVGKTSVELNIWNNLNDRKKLTQELLRNGFVENFETRFHTKNGKLKDGLMSASIIQLNGTNHILSNTRDITERKQAENNLKQYSTKLELSNKELAEFVYIASHDLKEPLRGISNCATFIQMDHPKLEEPIKKELYHIISLAERLDIFINELLAFSKIGNTDIPFTECLIKEIVEESIENIRSCGFYTNSEIIIKDFPDTPIICNKERLKHVYQNLITNGLKYNTKKHKRIEIGSFYENNENVYYVYDNGIGIEEKHHEIIFQIFKRLHPKEEFSGGTGVGLAIVKKVILQHHGKIWLKSSPNQGTTFYFTLNVKKD